MSKMKVRVLTTLSVGQEYLLRENTSNENSLVAFLCFWFLHLVLQEPPFIRCKYCSCLLCWHGIVGYLVPSAFCLVSMHDCEELEDAAVPSACSLLSIKVAWM